ncbi:MAG: hypothetical protein JST16_10790 [Bdellovibrionales bacterium]|nr:hypothetical protein [Bdellovibrionales bacterium]
MNHKLGALGCLTAMALSAGCGKSSSSSGTTFVDALGTVSTTMEDMKKLDPTASSFVSRSKSGLHLFTAFGSAWDSGTVALPDGSGSSVSIKEYMGKQLDPSAVGDDGHGRQFALNVFGRFNNAMMIGCALTQVGADIDSATGYPNVGTVTMKLTSEALTKMKEKCGMSEADATYMGSITPPIEIGAVISNPSDTTYYDRKVVMTLPEAMSGSGGATQYFYMRYNSSEINILDIEDQATFDSRTIVALNLATKVLKVEYYSGSNGSNLYFHRLYYDQTNDIGKLATYYGSTGNRVSYTLTGKPNAGGTFALSFDSDQTADYAGQACVNVSNGTVATDDSLSCTLTGTAVSSATVLSDAYSRVGATSWSTPADTMTNSYTEDTIFTAVAP